MMLSLRKALPLCLLLVLGGCSLLSVGWSRLRSPNAAQPEAADTVQSPRSSPVPVASSSPVVEAPRSILPAPLMSEGSISAPSDETLLRTLSLRVGQHLVVPKGRFPKDAQVVVEIQLTALGRVLAPKIRHSSGYKVLDAAVLRALTTAQPLPVPSTIGNAGSMPLRLVFYPLKR